MYDNNGVLNSKIVEESVVIWPVGRKTHIPARKPGRPAANSNVWTSVPPFVRNANITPDTIDYHGNFNADIFEKLFKKLGKRLHEEFSGCIIHMDGAKYHFRTKDPHPTTNTKHEDMLKWCLNKSKQEERKASGDRKILPTLPEGRTEYRKAELYEYSKQFKQKKVYETVRIANSFGFEVMKTPPYHCEVQPIEGVWGIVKNQIAH
jgi:hypothetical protein